MTEIGTNNMLYIVTLQKEKLQTTFLDVYCTNSNIHFQESLCHRIGNKSRGESEKGLSICKKRST